MILITLNSFTNLIISTQSLKEIFSNALKKHVKLGWQINQIPYYNLYTIR